MIHAALELDAITKAFNGRTIIDRLSLAVAPGEYVTVLGPSGAGKSTLLRGIAGFETLDYGDVRMNGRSIRDRPAHVRGIGFVFQSFALFMVGPIAFMLSRIDPSLIEAARDLGASTGRILRTIILPLSMPGVVVGAIFVSVMVLGEFATPAALSGRKVNLLGNIIVTQVGSLKWAFAAVVGVVLTAIMAAVVAVLLRFVDLRNEL